MSDFVPVQRIALSDEDIQAKADLLEQLQADRAWLVHEQPFLASLALQFRLMPVVDVRIETAATDGITIWANPYFFATLSEEQRRFVLAHEVWHGALSHIQRRFGREPEIWNVAIDHEVNTLLIEAGFEMPPGGVLFETETVHNAEAIYQRLIGKNPPRLKKSDTEGLGTGQHLSKGGCRVQKGKFDSDFTPNLSADLQEVWRQRVVGAAQRVQSLRGGRGVGEITGHLSRIVDDLMEPTVHWTDYLKRFVTTLYSGERRWSPPNRRHVYRGLYLPSSRTVCLDIVVAIDTSGSTERDLPQFLAELKEILNVFGNYKVRVLQCDVEITSDEIYTHDHPFSPEQVVFKGFGGTLFTPVFDLIAASEAPPRALIYLTDGHAPCPFNIPTFPVLWAITKGGRTPANWGDVVFLE